jgi:hypothetical protein
MRMDPQFVTLITRVLILGGAIGIIGTGVLLLAFRAFGKPHRAAVLIMAVLGFVLICCLLLLRLSLLK